MLRSAILSHHVLPYAFRTFQPVKIVDDLWENKTHRKDNGKNAVCFHRCGKNVQAAGKTSVIRFAQVQRLQQLRMCFGIEISEEQRGSVLKCEWRESDLSSLF